MSVEERRWVDVPTFAAYLNISPVTAYRLTRTDPRIRAVTMRFGRRVQVNLWAWQEGEERRMAGGAS
jgi:hypothetical protein